MTRVCVFVAWVQDLDAKTQAEIDREVEALMKQMGDQSADWQRNLNALGESVHGTYRPWMSELEAAVRAEIERLKARGQGVSAKELERRLAELRAKLESLSAGGEAVRFPAGLSAIVVFCFSCPFLSSTCGLRFVPRLLHAKDAASDVVASQRCLNRGVGCVWWIRARRRSVASRATACCPTTTRGTRRRSGPPLAARRTP